MTMTVAAVGDVHIGRDSAGRLGRHLQKLNDEADVLLLAGDLTQCGTAAEAEILADELAPVEIPVVAVLGNHDLHSGQEAKIGDILEARGIALIENTFTVIDVDGQRLGIAGATGFGGGFSGACASDFGEPEMKAFVARARAAAEALEHGLSELGNDGVDARIALLHYSPVTDTLQGERLEIYPFLGSYLLAEAVDRAGADLVVHGHAHGGIERGVTPGGVRVHNVALPVIRRPYRLFRVP
jgi:Icc-related predicted phosphoesterase